MGKRKRQTHLTFEPVVAGDNSNNSSQASAPAATTATDFSPSNQPNFAPANVRFSKNAVRVRSHPKMKATKAERHRKRKLAQSKIPSTKELREKVSFMPTPSAGSSQRAIRTVSEESSEESAVEVVGAGDESDDVSCLPASGSQEVPQMVEDDSDDDDDVPLPTSASKGPRSSQSVASRMRQTVIQDEDDEEEDEDPIQPPPSSARRRGRPVIVDVEESEDEDVAPSPSKRRRINQTPRKVAFESDSDGDIETPSTNARPGRGRLLRTLQIPSSPIKRPKGHRSEKQKKMELLKRRRAGEKITELTESESESDDDYKRAIYDTDSADELQALKEFDDDEDDNELEEEKDDASSKKKKKKSKKTWQAQKSRESEGSEDLDDFVVEDDGPLGAPDMSIIPLQFTAASHLPLKDQFPYAIEWLVHRRINPAFDRNDPVYINAWRRLNDEFRGLASSKFASSAWKTEFFRSLRARPKMECFEVGTAGTGYENCEACGRSGHPSTWQVVFAGGAYNNDTLDDLEESASARSTPASLDDEDEDEDDDDDDEKESDTRSRDGQGMPLISTSKQWNVGSTCCSNAETAHSLMHWKYHLKIFVEEKLEDQGLMKPEKLAERENMKPKKRARFANKIVDEWRDKKVISSLYTNFKQTLEEARNKSTTGNRGGGGWR